MSKLLLFFMLNKYGHLKIIAYIFLKFLDLLAYLSVFLLDPSQSNIC